MVARIKKNDEIEVCVGKDRGKRGIVEVVSPKEDKALVKGINLVVRHVKARRQGEVGGIRKEESYMHCCKLMPVCSSCKKACRVQVKVMSDGKHKRACAQCKAVF